MIQLQDYTRLDDDLLIDDLLKLSVEKVLVFPQEEEDDKNITILKRLNTDYWTQGYVGMLEVNGRSVFIGSRFDDVENNNYYFTHYVLAKALGMKTLIFEDMKVRVAQERILEELLAIVFVKQIDKAYKKGVFRKYRTYERNDAKLKGKIDITRHIKMNPLFNGNIAYSYREYTPDNDVNRLIFTALVYLEKKQRNLMHFLTRKNRNVKDYVCQMEKTIEPASKQEIQRILQRGTKKITHSVYKEWEEVRKTAILILRHMGVNISKQNQSDINGILINMTKVWEQYLESILKDGIDPKWTVKAQEEYQALLYEEKKGRRTLKPDLCIHDESDNNDNIVLILDAKYKNSWSEIAVQKWNENWPREDIFQIFSYMYAIDCGKAGIICPCRGEAKGIKEDGYSVSEKMKEDKFFLFPLQIPEMDEQGNYFRFCEEMEKSERKLQRDICNLIKK